MAACLMLSFCNKLGLMYSNIWRHLFIGQTWWPPRSPSDSPQWPGGPRNLLVWKHSDGCCSRSSSSSDRPVIQAPHETGSGLWHELPKHHRDEKINDPTSDFLSHKACWVLWCQVRGLLDITHTHFWTLTGTASAQLCIESNYTEASAQHTAH